MIFVVVRTSMYNNAKPCAEAFRREFPDFEKGSCSEEYYNKFIAPLKYREWVVRIKSLKDLIQFIKKYGNKIVMTDDSIEIYDDDRE